MDKAGEQHGPGFYNESTEHLTEAQKIAKAITEGYPDVDQECGECKLVFKNYHHFLRCASETCPMKDGKGTLLEQMLQMENGKLGNL